MNSEEIKQCVGFLKIVGAEVQRCQKVTQNLLQFSRRKNIEMLALDITIALEAALLVVQYHIKNSNIKIIKHYAKDLPKTLGDRDQLQQVFLNIVLNAKDAIEENGQITISTEKVNDQWVQVRVHDTGCGIPENILEHIFEPLYTTKEENKGTGLGLSVSREIVTGHQGIIDVDSVEGQGTTFTVKLPIYKEE